MRKFFQHDAVNRRADHRPVEPYLSHRARALELRHLRLRGGHREPGLVCLFGGFDLRGAQLLHPVEIELRALDCDSCDGELALDFRDARLLLRIIEPHDDLALLHRVAFFYSDPFHLVHRARAEFDPLAIDDVAADGEHRVTGLRGLLICGRGRGLRGFFAGLRGLAGADA